MYDSPKPEPRCDDCTAGMQYIGTLPRKGAPPPKYVFKCHCGNVRSFDSSTPYAE
jgi:hypothetical protein